MDKDVVNLKKWFNNLGLNIDGSVDDEVLKKYARYIVMYYAMIYNVVILIDYAQHSSIRLYYRNGCTRLIKKIIGFTLLQVNATATPGHVEKYHQTCFAQRRSGTNKKIDFIT